MKVLRPRIRFLDVTKRYPGVLALDGITFDVAPGCVHAIVGENGAGKSTLMKVLSGSVPPDAGAMALDGKPFEPSGPRHAQQLGVAIVHQELSLVADLSVSENVFLGHWPRGVLGLVDFPAMHRRAEERLGALGIALPVRHRVERLSVAARQMVEIARALSLEARVLVLDEPSAVLTPHELRALFQLIRKLTQGGVSVLYISHRLEEVMTLADYVTVLRDGRHVSSRPIGQTDRGRMITELVGRPLEEEFPRRERPKSEIVLRVEGLAVAKKFSAVSFEVRRGEILALTGLVGSGRSSVGRALIGALPTTGGTIHVGSRRVVPRSPREAMSLGIAMLPEERKSQGLMLERSTRENVTLAHLSDVATAGWVHAPAEREAVRRSIVDLGIKTPSAETFPSALSGGNQQKVMLARWLSREYPVIILDEPTRGVDVGARAEIYELIAGLCRRGAAVLLMTSEFEEAIGMGHRIGVMSRGRWVDTLDNADAAVSNERLLQLALSDAKRAENEAGG